MNRDEILKPVEDEDLKEYLDRAIDEIYFKLDDIIDTLDNISSIEDLHYIEDAYNNIVRLKSDLY